MDADLNRSAVVTTEPITAATDAQAAARDPNPADPRAGSENRLIALERAGLTPELVRAMVTHLAKYGDRVTSPKRKA